MKKKSIHTYIIYIFINIYGRCWLVTERTSPDVATLYATNNFPDSNYRLENTKFNQMEM